ncbi:MAG TPA: NAD(P)-dependent oxidoreductase [Steroidobacter sp.]
MSAITSVAVVGLGRIGLPMAINIATAGFAVKAWNRSQRAYDELPPGMTIAENAQHAVAGASVVILVLSDAGAIESLLFGDGVVKHIGLGSIVIDMGTTGPSAAKDHAKRLAERGIRYLDAPVSGGVRGATDGTLSILVGGDPQTFADAEAVLDTMGRPTLLGPTGCGQIAKVANQLIVACYIGAVAEGVRFAELQGMDAAALIAALEGGFADSAVLRQHGRRMAARNFIAGGTCSLHLKDLRLAAELAGEDFERFVNSNEALHRFERLVQSGHEGADHSAYYLTYENGSA